MKPLNRHTIEYYVYRAGEPGVVEEHISQYNWQTEEWEPRPEFLNRMQANMEYTSVLKEDRMEEDDDIPNS